MGVYRANEQEELHGALYELSYYTLEVLNFDLVLAQVDSHRGHTHRL